MRGHGSPSCREPKACFEELGGRPPVCPRQSALRAFLAQPSVMNQSFDRKDDLNIVLGVSRLTPYDVGVEKRMKEPLPFEKCRDLYARNFTNRVEINP